MPKGSTPKKKHSVKAQVQILDLTRAGSSMDFEIFADGEKLGMLSLGQGSINWKKGRKQYWGKPISWTKFAELMTEVAYET
ncbi:MAG: hypothetical protein ABI999_17210 [Acidobacteriota bacterium]